MQFSAAVVDLCLQWAAEFFWQRKALQGHRLMSGCRIRTGMLWLLKCEVGIAANCFYKHFYHWMDGGRASYQRVLLEAMVKFINTHCTNLQMIHWSQDPPCEKGMMYYTPLASLSIAYCLCYLSASLSTLLNHEAHTAGPRRFHVNQMRGCGKNIFKLFFVRSTMCALNTTSVKPGV